MVTDEGRIYSLPALITLSVISSLCASDLIVGDEYGIVRTIIAGRCIQKQGEQCSGNGHARTPPSYLSAHVSPGSQAINVMIARMGFTGSIVICVLEAARKTNPPPTTSVRTKAYVTIITLEMALAHARLTSRGIRAKLVSVGQGWSGCTMLNPISVKLAPTTLTRT
jgi:hypothetical protein